MLTLLPGIFFLAVGFAIRRVYRWIFHRGLEHRAADFLEQFDDNYVELVSTVERAREEDGLPIGGPEGDAGPRQRFIRLARHRPGRGREMAFALAELAYFQFGFRLRSEANELITRKFMRDSLAEFKDLRKKDAAGVIDVALPLSFLPSQAMRSMGELESTDAFQDRSRADPSARASWWPIGRARPGQRRGWWPFGRQPHHA